jgi:BirA family biotin operon repressor/biotin-[acetyl-CoA-carboxylase] ligase
VAEMMHSSLCVEELHRGWTPQRVGRDIQVLAECTSTNDCAFQAAENGPADGLVIFSDHQTAGRGRQGRDWVSPRGASLLFSLVIEESQAPILPQTPEVLSRAARPVPMPPGKPSAASNRHRASREMSVEQQMGGRLTLLAAVAVCEAIRHATDLTPAIKWPNDLRVNGRKLAGILIESRPLPQRAVRAWVVGIGINCLQQAGHFPAEWHGTVTSLEIESREPVDRAAMGRALLQRLDAWLSAHEESSDILYERWLEHAEPLGGQVRLVSAGREYRGRIVSVDPACGLVVQCEDGLPVWFDPMQTRIL